MSVISCFWALLSLEDFEFIYLPDFVTQVQIGNRKTPGDILLSRSLLDFIHPEELAPAKADLLNFIRIKTLAGAVTRCRLKNIKKSNLYQGYGEQQDDKTRHQDWIITDVVMYTATNNTILTFFHTHEEISTTENSITGFVPIFTKSTNDQTSSCCGSQQLHFNKAYMVSKLQSLPSTDIKNTTTINTATTAIINIDSTSYRIFQIYDTKTQKQIISWPTPSITTSNELFIKNGTKLAYMITIREIEQHLFNNTQQQQQQQQEHRQTAACTHHCHSNSNLIIEPYGLCRVERIIITYGSLTFSSFQLTPLNFRSSSALLSASKDDKASFSSYHHYMYCSTAANHSYSRSSSVLAPTTAANFDDNNSRLRRKSNINDILNDSNTLDHLSNRMNNSMSTTPPINYHSNSRSPPAPIHSSQPSSPYILPLLSPSYYNNSSRHRSPPSSLISFQSSNSNSNIPEMYTNNIDIPPTNEDSNNHSSSRSVTKTTASLTKSTFSPTSNKHSLPRAWRSRFGAYEKKCENCQTNTSPEWRRGPSGHKTLCNACGLRFYRKCNKKKL